MPHVREYRRFAALCGFLLISLAAIPVSADPVRQPVPTTQPENKEPTDQFTRLRWIRARAAHREAIRVATSLGTQLEFDHDQRRTATKSVTTLVSAFYSEWSIGSYPSIDRDVSITLQLSADDKFESAISNLLAQVRAAIETVASPDQIGRFRRYESTKANKNVVQQDFMKAICGEPSTAEWPPPAVAVYAQYVVDGVFREGDLSRLDFNQRLHGERLLQDLLFDYFSDNRDDFCNYHATFSCALGDVHLENDPVYCRLYLPILRHSQELWDDFESRFSKNLTELELEFLESFMSEQRETTRREIGRMRTVIRRADAAKSSTTRPTTQAPARQEQAGSRITKPTE